MKTLISLIFLPFRIIGLLFSGSHRNEHARRDLLHARNVEKSRLRLQKLSVTDFKYGIASQLNYLRKINPLIFEELILTAIESKGHKVIRSQRYTGDGGYDGSFFLNGERVLIQAKRYKDYICAADVLAFSNLCLQLNTRGIFVHTGKTGKQSISIVGKHVEIISGRKLISLLLPASSSK